MVSQYLLLDPQLLTAVAEAVAHLTHLLAAVVQVVQAEAVTAQLQQ